MSGITPVRTENHTPPIGAQSPPQRSCPAPLTLLKLACAVAALYVADHLFTLRQACVQWNKGVTELEGTVGRQKAKVESLEQIYRDRARLNCMRDSAQSSSFEPGDVDIVEFCSGDLFPTDKIPYQWTTHVTINERQLGLDSYAAETAVAKQILEQDERYLKKVDSKKPLYCTRV